MYCGCLSHIEETVSSQPPSSLCSSLRQVNLSNNQLTSLPPGLLHLTRIQRLSAAKNQLTVLFDIPTSMFQLQSNSS